MDRHVFNLRLPVPLWLELREAARKNERSVHAEIVHRLRVSLAGYRQ